MTTQFNVVNIADQKLYRVGKMVKLSSDQYPYLIYDEADNRVFVNASGAIVNKTGGKIGRLKVHGS